MKVTRQARLLLGTPIEGGTGQLRGFLATELTNALAQLVATLPPDARVEPNLQLESPLQREPAWRLGGAVLVFSWEEDLA